MSYKLRYSITPEIGKFEKHDANENQGLCDAFILISIIQDENGWVSICPAGVDARSGKLEPISDLDIFKSWVSIAKYLSSKNIPEHWKFLTQETFNTVSEIIRQQK